jgi:hypothetical protein
MGRKRRTRKLFTAYCAVIKRAIRRTVGSLAQEWV